MPKKITREVDFVSLRLPPDLGKWLRGIADSRADSVNERVVEMIEDMRDWFGLTAPMVEVLQADLEKSGIRDRNAP